MKIKMKLLSDTIFGSGNSIPGGEDIAVLHDDQGFPYYKGSTLKGLFREQLADWYSWQKTTDDQGGQQANGQVGQQANDQAEYQIKELLGSSGDVCPDEGKIFFSDLVLSDGVKNMVLEEIGEDPERVLESFTSLRTFTALDDNGTVKEGSLRSARCVNQGIWLEGEIRCPKEAEPLVQEILGLIKWVGTMRNRGFGKVYIVGEV